MTTALTPSSGVGPCWLRAQSCPIRNHELLRPRPRANADPHRLQQCRLASPHGGPGIGLSVVRLLIEAMGGRVQVVAQPGGGCCFSAAAPGAG